MDWKKLGAVSREMAREILGGISDPTLDGLLRDGELRSLQAGRRVLIPVSSILHYLGDADDDAPRAEIRTEAAAAAPELSPRAQKALARANRRLSA